MAEIEAEVAPFTPAALEAEDEAWMPWEAPAAAEETAVAAEEDDLPWLISEPGEPAAFTAPAEEPAALPEAAADETPVWSGWTDAEEEAPAAAEAAAGEAEPLGAGAYSFDAEPFEAGDAELEPFAAAELEPFGSEAAFPPVAEPESIGGESLPYAVDETPEPEAEAEAWEAPPAAHVSEAEAGPEVEAGPWEPAAWDAGAEDAGAGAWSVEFAVDESVTEDAAAEEEPEPAAGMEDFYAGEENAAAEAALYSPAGEAEPAAYGAGPETEEESYGPAAVEELPVPGAAGATPDAFAALGELADRLEGIARTLRERPADVLAGEAGADPLELLITGFALGYAQGRRRGGD